MTYPVFVGFVAIGVVIFFILSPATNSGNAGLIGGRIESYG